MLEIFISKDHYWAADGSRKPYYTVYSRLYDSGLRNTIRLDSYKTESGAYRRMIRELDLYPAAVCGGFHDYDEVPSKFFTLYSGRDFL